MEDQKSLFEFDIDDASAREITDLTRWSKLFAILMISVLSIVFLIVVTAWNKIFKAFTTDMGQDSSAITGFMLVVVVIVLAIVGVCMFFLIRSANRMKNGLFQRDQQLFNNGLNDLKIFFIFMGVFGILSLLGGLMAFG